MRITETIDNDNNVSRISKLLDTGNLVPPIWYHKLLRECGKSDCTAIAILSELVLLHCDQGSKEFQLNFKYFKDKFNFGLSQVKDAVIRLEKLGLVIRSPRTVMILGRSFANEMFLVLNIEQVLDLTGGTESKKFQYSIRNNNNSPTEISSGNQDKLEKGQYIARNLGTPSAEISTDSENKMAKSGAFSGNSHLPSAEISSVLYIDISKNNLKSRYRDRSSKSSFLKISDEENKKADIEENEEVDTVVTNSLQFGKVREASSLNRAIAKPIEQSNFKTFDKKFSNHVQEEITDKEVEAEATLKPEHEEKTETKEKDSPHDQPVSAETSEKQPSVITKIRSKFSFFGKKLSAFYPLSNEDRDLLVAKSGRDFDLNFINQLMLRISDKYPGHKFYNKNCVMNYMTKLLAHELRDAVKVSNGCFRFKNNQEDRQIQPQEILQTESELCHKSANQFVSAISANGNSVNGDNSIQSTNYGNNHGNNNIPAPPVDTATKDTDSIWSRVRRSLVEHFRDGEWLDRNWFSKLEAIYDHDSQKLTLKAPTKLIRDRVWQQYGYLIERYCTEVNYQLVGVQS